MGLSAQMLVLAMAVFFALLVGSNLVNFYLRRIDHLPIDREDVRAFARNVRFTLFLLAIAGMFHYLSFFMALAILLCGAVAYQVLKINGLLKQL